MLLQIQDKVNRLAQVLDAVIRRVAQFFGISLVNPNGGAASGMAAVNVAPAISNHETARKIDVQVSGRTQEHAGTRFAKFGGWFFVTGIIAHLDSIDGEFATHMGMDHFHHFLFQYAAADIGLIRGDNQAKTGLLEEIAGFEDSWENLTISQAGGRVGFSIAEEDAVDDAVAVEEGRPAKGSV